MQVTNHVQYQYETHLPLGNILKKEKGLQNTGPSETNLIYQSELMHFGRAAAQVQLRGATAQAVYTSHSSACTGRAAQFEARLLLIC